MEVLPDLEDLRDSEDLSNLEDLKDWIRNVRTFLNWLAFCILLSK